MDFKEYVLERYFDASSALFDIVKFYTREHLKDKKAVVYLNDDLNSGDSFIIGDSLVVYYEVDGKSVGVNFKTV